MNIMRSGGLSARHCQLATWLMHLQCWINKWCRDTSCGSINIGSSGPLKSNRSALGLRPQQFMIDDQLYLTYIKQKPYTPVWDLCIMCSPSLIAILHLSWLVHSASGLASSQCRCTYGRSCWPSVSDFSVLASQVSQPLIHPVPPASACYTTANHSGNCTDFLDNQFNADWRSNQSGSMQYINFESFTFSNGSISACYSNTTLDVPCAQGSVPVIGVDARSIGDIQAAVKFAVKHNLRLATKNTG